MEPIATTILDPVLAGLILLALEKGVPAFLKRLQRYYSRTKGSRNTVVDEDALESSTSSNKEEVFRNVLGFFLAQKDYLEAEGYSDTEIHRMIAEVLENPEAAISRAKKDISPYQTKQILRSLFPNSEED